MPFQPISLLVSKRGGVWNANATRQFFFVSLGEQIFGEFLEKSFLCEGERSFITFVLLEVIDGCIDLFQLDRAKLELGLLGNGVGPPRW